MNNNADPTPSDALDLPGLDGANPLGFLAALGLLYVLDHTLGASALTIHWRPSGGTWTPALRVTAGEPISEERLLTILEGRLARSIDTHPALLLPDLDATSDDWRRRRQLIEEIAGAVDRPRQDWAAAVASDAAAPESINQLQTARRDYFIKNIESVLIQTKPAHLRRAVFRPWDYADALDNQSLHWDPSEDRRHAHQWNKPSGDPDRKKYGGMLGANRLALEAIPLFTSVPEAGSLRTLGFTGNRSTNTRWTWPIWETPIPLRVVSSLLGSPLLQDDVLEGDEVASLKARGVVALYRTRRILVGKTPNFTPALCLA